jgi:hypothetical protein
MYYRLLYSSNLGHLNLQILVFLEISWSDGILTFKSVFDKRKINVCFDLYLLCQRSDNFMWIISQIYRARQWNFSVLRNWKFTIFHKCNFGSVQNIFRFHKIGRNISHSIQKSCVEIWQMFPIMNLKVSHATLWINSIMWLHL